MELLNLLRQADRHLGRLDMYSETITNLSVPTVLKLLEDF